MMLSLLLYAYMIGQRSSRRIEAACRTDAAHRVICGEVTPDHATIARFLIDHQDAIEGVFVEVLRLCAAAGLVTVGTVAIDGTKIGSDAALDQNAVPSGMICRHHVQAWQYATGDDGSGGTVTASAARMTA
jgi:transposase